MNSLGNKVKAAPYLIPLHTRKSLASAPPLPAAGSPPTNSGLYLSQPRSPRAIANVFRPASAHTTSGPVRVSSLALTTWSGFRCHTTWLFLQPNLPGRPARTTASVRAACPAPPLPATGSRA